MNFLRAINARLRYESPCVLVIMPPFAPVAQLDRVPGYEPGGRGFKSCRARQFLQGVVRKSDDPLAFGGDFSASRRGVRCTTPMNFIASIGVSRVATRPT